MLLKAEFEGGDYHGFLKNAHRFMIYKGLEAEIEKAILYLQNKGQKADADGWKRKLDALRRDNK